MKKYFYFLPILLTMGTLSAEESVRVEPKNSQIGRYQIAGCSRGKEGWPQLYLLDTATGEVWRSREKCFSSSYKEWIPSVAPIEQEIAE